jgi:FG-GAP repeat
VLTAANGQFGDCFGTTLAFDGKTLVVGAPYANNGAGAIYVYRYASGIWKAVAELTASDGQYGDLFGNAVALSGSTIAVGAPGRNSDTGGAYLFMLQGTTWSQQAELTSADSQIEDAFGTSVGLDGGNLLVGSPNADSYDLTLVGAAYLYTFSSGQWNPVTKLIAPNGQYGAQFGAAVAISGNSVAAGAPGGDGVPSAVYTFTQGAGGWLLNSKLNDGWMQQDQFGAALALSGSKLLIGAYGGSSLTGAAYLFTLNRGAWSLSSTLTAADGQQFDDFGASVALSGSSAAVGAPYANYGAGSLYGF